jgi:uncharacterized protein
VIYLDTSALIKLVVLEPNTDLAWGLVSADEVATSRITWAEARAALARRERDAPASAENWRQARSHLGDLWRRFKIIEVTQPVVVLAGDYAETFALRGFDAVHLASADMAKRASPGAWTFLSFDIRLNRGAKLLGLNVPEWAGV